MHCRTFRTNGTVAIVCGARPRKRYCRDCGAEASLQCDAPLRGKKSNKTCDAHICKDCAVSVGENLDLCQMHAKQPRQEGLPWVT